jgi:hypothetical protein
MNILVNAYLCAQRVSPVVIPTLISDITDQETAQLRKEIQPNWCLDLYVSTPVRKHLLKRLVP